MSFGWNSSIDCHPIRLTNSNVMVQNDTVDKRVVLFNVTLTNKNNV